MDGQLNDSTSKIEKATAKNAIKIYPQLCSGPEGLTWSLMLDAVSPPHAFFRPLSWLADAGNASEKTIGRHIDKLEKLGLVTNLGRQGRRTVSYQLQHPEKNTPYLLSSRVFLSEFEYTEVYFLSLLTWKLGFYSASPLESTSFNLSSECKKWSLSRASMVRARETLLDRLVHFEADAGITSTSVLVACNDGLLALDETFARLLKAPQDVCPRLKVSVGASKCAPQVVQAAPQCVQVSPQDVRYAPQDVRISASGCLSQRMKTESKENQNNKFKADELFCSEDSLLVMAEAIAQSSCWEIVTFASNEIHRLFTIREISENRKEVCPVREEFFLWCRQANKNADSPTKYIAQIARANGHAQFSEKLCDQTWNSAAQQVQSSLIHAIKEQSAELRKIEIECATCGTIHQNRKIRSVWEHRDMFGNPACDEHNATTYLHDAAVRVVEESIHDARLIPEVLSEIDRMSDTDNYATSEYDGIRAKQVERSRLAQQWRATHRQGVSVT